MTQETEYQKMIEKLKSLKIHYSAMNSWNRQYCEGYNEGLDSGIKLIENKLKKIKKCTTSNT